MGIRAHEPDGMWHVDTSVIRLNDSSKVYLRAIIDNFSRRILAWSVSLTLEPMATAPLLVKAMEEREKSAGTRETVDAQSLLVDGGVENFNEAVDKLVNQGLLERIRAQPDVKESNSMIERFWLGAKHCWLFLHDLDSLAAVRRLTEFYVTEYNSTLPHAAHAGRTPDEVYVGEAEDTADELARATHQACTPRDPARSR